MYGSIGGMLITLQELSVRCPALSWYEKHLHTITINLPTIGQSIILRGKAKDFSVDFTPEMLSKFCPDIVYKRTLDTQEAICELINTRVSMFLNDLTKLIDASRCIMEDFSAGNIDKVSMALVSLAMKGLLVSHWKESELTQWFSWLNLCEAFVILTK